MIKKAVIQYIQVSFMQLSFRLFSFGYTLGIGRDFCYKKMDYYYKQIDKMIKETEDE